MVAKKTYAATAIGAVGAVTFGGFISVGTPADEQGYEEFSKVVLELEAMEAQGLIRIDERRHESTTGRCYVDMVRFTRLK